MTCILKKCAHPGSDKHPSACRSLAAAGMGECGATYALARAAEPGGYLVLSHGNLTVKALVAAGFAYTRPVDSHSCIVVANPKAHAFAAKQGRIDAPEAERVA